MVENVKTAVDIIEIGTPMVIEYGMEAVRTIKKNFPNLEVLADLKIMDAGYYEAKEAFDAGADYVTVLGVTDNRTIKGCVQAAKEAKGQIVVDMICVEDLPRRIQKMEEIGTHFVSVHVGVDQQAMGKTPLEQLEIMTKHTKSAKISVAGGISSQTIQAYKHLNPDIVIVGSGITHANDPKKEAQKIYEHCQ